MNNAEKKKRNWQKIIRPIALCLALTFLLSCATYAWMKRDWTPTIEGDGIKIMAGASLTFLFEDEAIEETNISELLGLGEDTFEFKSVSNCSGQSEDFFALTYSPLGKNYDTLNKLTLEKDLSEAEREGSAPYTILGKKNGYIDLTFTVGSSDNYEKEIYFDTDSCIKSSAELEEGAIDPSKAIRFSLTVYNGDKQEAHYIFTKNGHLGINNEYEQGSGFIAHGQRLYDDSGNKVITFTHPGIGQDFYLRKTPAEGIVQDFTAWQENQEGEPNTLFNISNGQLKTLKIRIWLEGEDDYCVDKIAGSELDILLKFSARNASGQES